VALTQRLLWALGQQLLALTSIKWRCQHTTWSNSQQTGLLLAVISSIIVQ
jgi:hypothetical protein